MRRDRDHEAAAKARAAAVVAAADSTASYRAEEVTDVPLPRKLAIVKENHHALDIEGHMRSAEEHGKPSSQRSAMASRLREASALS